MCQREETLLGAAGGQRASPRASWVQVFQVFTTRAATTTSSADILTYSTYFAFNSVAFMLHCGTCRWHSSDSRERCASRLRAVPMLRDSKNSGVGPERLVQTDAEDPGSPPSRLAPPGGCDEPPCRIVMHAYTQRRRLSHGTIRTTPCPHMVPAIVNNVKQLRAAPR